MYYVYLLASSQNGMVYIGVTNSITRRLEEHQTGLTEGFTRRYGIRKLVYYETFLDVDNAIAREKQLKRWSRKKKNALVESKNPAWEDLSEKIFAEQ